MARRSFDLLWPPLPLNVSKIIRRMEQDVETVINVLRPEVHEAKAAVDQAVLSWRQSTALEKWSSNEMPESTGT
ncbi:unnamed protein product [Spirodela intermedia]|uniref:Uncharacterized protein n=1 Tax=Spirodela intermedia TaxID=51605 RepID=A0A7I8I980_SPIIN|nr:unnamed protein product [Spirodela intermedia]CAA6654236.1 unnamed protein product [Spirodela intermedia]